MYLARRWPHTWGVCCAEVLADETVLRSRGCLCWYARYCGGRPASEGGRHQSPRRALGIDRKFTPGQEQVSCFAAPNVRAFGHLRIVIGMGAAHAAQPTGLTGEILAELDFPPRSVSTTKTRCPTSCMSQTARREEG